MNLIEITIVNTILISFPILILVLLFIYDKNVGKEEKNLFYDLILITSFYIIVKFGIPIIENKLFLILNIPLLLAYYKNRKLSILLISILIIVYNYHNLGINIYYLTLEYITYYLIYILLNEKYSYILIGVLNAILLMFWAFLSGYFEISFEILLSMTIVICSSFLSLIILIVLFKKSEDILKYHRNLKEIEQEKQFRLTIFRIIHEIKNPIAVCKGYLDMFDTNDITCNKKYVPILKEEIARTLILLQDFLIMNKIKIEKEIIDINMILEDVTDNFKEMFKEKEITYEFNIPEEDVYINGDYNRLTQVVINIVKNSVEALEGRRKKFIKIDSIVNGDDIVITISDNGPGISKDALDRIKEPFFTTKVSGTGLGVSLSYEIIEGHNGKIKYISEENHGTIVKILLPLKDKTNTN